ncbi:hypothetical protein [Candidatus Bealeia paramacronuclearis]
MMFSMVLLTVWTLSSSLPSVMAELDDCTRQCFSQKQNCFEGLEDPLGQINHCQDNLFECKTNCASPHKGAHYVHGFQLDFKIKPLIKDIQLFKKKEREQNPG